ncbi:iron complex transport system substrate-binding protein [Kibdelosporangium banguiense]|uniref:Iron complex transport system substrate-binding protein n=1 Tax=Kibdelosporangium banguiense TaxID=1365924 RepID=A0ABS4TS54_9PSEU|nr:iron-siderophore ABC transporter substrate-binding protein [Kibdelosporangium banguiense]MBP2326829.1 iron complex transport system substrate-binding protein [Kibdelosporangium banguiense]
MFTVLRPSRSPLRTVSALAAAALLLAGCGTTEAPAAAPGSTTASAPTGPVDVKDERGTVHLDKPATAVVSLEWGLTENLLALGVKPVGAADVKGHNTYDKIQQLDPKTPDVGSRSEPGLDAIVALKPDLVVTTTDVPESVLAQLAGQVKVLALRGSDASDPIGYMRRTVTTLAEVTGKQEQGKKLLADFDAKVASAKDTLAKAGKAGTPFTMSDGYLDSGKISVRMYTPGSFLGGISAQLGLTNQWTTGGDKDYGLATTDVEGLTKITDAKTTFLYTAADADGDFTKALADNAVWKQLPFVQSAKVHRIPDGIWMFGGPPSANAFIDALVDALT